MDEKQKKEFEQKLKDKKLWFCPLPFTHVFSSLSVDLHLAMTH